MQPDVHLWDLISPYTVKYGSRVSVSGVRYGSVLYIGFGTGVTQSRTSRASIIQCPVEIEIGADSWQLMEEEEVLLNSDFSDVDTTRQKLMALLQGREIVKIETSDLESTIFFEANLKLQSQVVIDPAAGFLYSFQAVTGPSWESVDGVNVCT